MEANVKPTTTTVGMLAHTDVLSDGQRNTITYNTEAEQQNPPAPANDPMQALWKDNTVASAMGIVEHEEPEVKDETPILGEEEITVKDSTED